MSDRDKTIAIQPPKQPETTDQACYQCGGKGYTELRDCAGEVQRTETCSFCEGRGYSVAASQE